MKTRSMAPALLAALLAATTVCAKDDKEKGHGAGGVRADHASEQGLEQGKAWAGSKEHEGVSEKSKKPKQEKKNK